MIAVAVDYVYRLDQPHVPGQLATVCATIAEGDGLIGDIATVTIGRDHWSTSRWKYTPYSPARRRVA